MSLKNVLDVSRGIFYTCTKVTFSVMTSHTWLNCLKSVSIMKSLRIFHCYFNNSAATALAGILRDNKNLHTSILQNCYLIAPEVDIIMSPLQALMKL